MISAKHTARAFALLFAAYLFVAGIFYLVAGEQLHRKTVFSDDMPAPSGVTGELTAGKKLEQPFRMDATALRGVTLKFFTYDRQNEGTLTLSILDGEEALYEKTVPVSTIPGNADYPLAFDTPVRIEPKQPLRLRLESADAPAGGAVTVYYGNATDLRVGTIRKDLSEDGMAAFDGKLLDGVLCYRMEGTRELWFGPRYWLFAAGGAVILLAYAVHSVRQAGKGRPSYLLRIAAAVKRYRFLIEQLVARDFKTKYKRSVLGVLWSFLNPLLTMVVQYVVFSTLFRSNIENFVVYLLSGIVCFSFFSETTNLALRSIVGNASLITKVYVPKYIYPVTRVLSSAINFFLSLIPLFVVMLATGTPFRASVLLLPFGIACLFLFCMGMAFLLSASMVFFRDTQFLWSVLTTLWMYLTPIFYPESIIPARFLPVYRLNPLYHIIGFFRSVLMRGVSPEPAAYLACLAVSLAPFLAGVLIFKKTQDRFVLNL